jgi:hypothetical protein
MAGYGKSSIVISQVNRIIENLRGRIDYRSTNLQLKRMRMIVLKYTIWQTLSVMKGHWSQLFYYIHPYLVGRSGLLFYESHLEYVPTLFFFH